MTFFLVVLLVVLIALSAFLSASETALFSLSPFALNNYRSAKTMRERLISHLMDHPREVLVTILILNVLSNLLIQNAVSSLFEQFLGWGLKVGIPLALTLIFGEVIPKSIALSNNVAISKKVSPVIALLMRLFSLIRSRLSALASFISRLLFFFLEEEPETTPDELRHIVKTSLKNQIVSVDEAKLIAGALDLKESTVKELMRPRGEILYYDKNEPISDLLYLFVQMQCSRIPICDRELNQLQGILSSKDFFLHQERVRFGSDLIPILKKPFFVPESTRAWVLLQSLRNSGEQLAIVVDEYGSVSGLITQEDLIETVVGEISDSRDAKNSYTRSGQDVIIASGKMELSEFEDLFGISLATEENVVTLGGWLIEQLGDIPTSGMKYATDDFLFYVLAADPNRVRRIYIRKIRSEKKKEKKRRG